MGRKKSHRDVAFKYEFDRLGDQKRELAYDILLSKLIQDYGKNVLEGAEELICLEKK
jgi:hypothetical protein